jgi:hypothetical protein
VSAAPSKAPRMRAALLGALVGFVALGGCTWTRSEPVASPVPDTKITRFSGYRYGEEASDPRTAAPSALDVEDSLRKIRVSYRGLTAFSRSDAEPLLTERQILGFSLVLASELPKLKDTQRLVFQFDDKRLGRGYAVEMEVFREGASLVYRFPVLVMNRQQTVFLGEPPPFQARLEPSSGIEVVNQATVSWMKYPLLVERRVSAEAEAQKREALQVAKDEGLFETGELPRLEKLAARAEVSLEVWKSYLDKRRTLVKARSQDLLDAAAYQAQVERLTDALGH